MDERQFWQYVDDACLQISDCQEKAVRLQTLLQTLLPEAIVAFEEQLYHQLDRAYHWDLWGAAYIINGGCSDDSFAYFRCWLISKGRVFFEQVLQRSDDLADLLSVEEEDATDCEALLSVAENAYRAVTGSEDMPRTPGGSAVEPEGEQWEEEDLDERFPKLGARFS